MMNEEKSITLKEILDIIETIHFNEKIQKIAKKIQELDLSKNYEAKIEIKFFNFLNLIIEEQKGESLKINNDKDEINYLLQRGQTSTNYLLKSAYYLLSYQIKPETNFIENAIDLITKMPLKEEKKYFIRDHEYVNHLCTKTMINYISKLYDFCTTEKGLNKKKKSEFNKKIKKILLDKNIQNEYKKTLVKSYLFASKDKNKIKTLLKKIEQKEKYDNSTTLNDYKLCLYICGLNKDTKKKKEYCEKIGDLYFKLSKNKEGLEKIIYLEKAIKYDRKYEKYYDENKKNITWNKMEIPLNNEFIIISKIHDTINTVADIFELINEFKINSKNINKELIDEMTFYSFDANNNINSKDSTFNNSIQNQCTLNIQYLIIKSLIEKKMLLKEDIIELINRNYEIIENIEFIKYIITLIFEKNKTKIQIKIIMRNLIPEFESIFRNICKLEHIPITKKTEEEKTLNHLISDNKIINKINSKISPENIKYIKFLLFKNYKNGLNMRNIICHGLTDKVYSERNMYLLFIVLIKIII